MRSSDPTLKAALPFITQARLLVRQQELRGLAHDLLFTIPDLARLNHSTIPLLNQQRALSACTSDVLVPFAKTPVPDPDFPAYDGANGQPFFKEAPRGLVGLSGESRISDANTPFFHVQFGSGPANALIVNEGQTFVSQVPAAPEGVRPIKPNVRPSFRPGTPCEDAAGSRICTPPAALPTRPCWPTACRSRPERFPRRRRPCRRARG